YDQRVIANLDYTLLSKQAWSPTLRGSNEVRMPMVRLWVLGLLMKRPLHGYEIRRYLELTRSDQWAGILSGSIYHAITRLEGEGFIQQTALERAGNRTRAVYAITPAGREEFRRLLI